MKDFRWNAWNLANATKHGCSVAEIQSVVWNGGRGYPRKCGGGKLVTVGRGQAGRIVEVIFVKDPDGTLYVIHAMPLSTRRRNLG